MRFLSTFLLVAVMATFAAPAFAQSPTETGYSETRGIIQQVDPQRAEAAPAVQTKNVVARSNTGPQLPFTGIDVFLVVAGGAALLATGAALRRATRRPRRAVSGTTGS